MFGSYDEGDHVVAREHIYGMLGTLGSPIVKKGTRGIIRRRPAGIFSDRCTVEFLRGGTVTVSGQKLRPALRGHGEEAFQRHKANRAGIQLGMAILALPGIIALIGYYLNGGTTAGIDRAAPSCARRRRPLLP
jgi:hypothetical protein